jgi:hypothetical protein
MVSFAPGTGGGAFGAGAASTGFVVADLNAASALSNTLFGLRGLSGAMIVSHQNQCRLLYVRDALSYCKP